MEVFGKLYATAAKHLPKGYADLGDLVLIDGSLIDAVLSMYWADYRTDSKKAKVHVGFDLNRGIPKKIFLSDVKVAFAYKLRWNIEIFLGWWKRHRKAYHLISRSKYGLMVQMLAGLITYILLAIYCHDQHHEKVSVKRLREISINIRNEMSIKDIVNDTDVW